jgi:acyl-CoA dehydrogenase
MLGVNSNDSAEAYDTMNFDFSEDLNMLREQARRFLADRCPPAAARKVLEGGPTLDTALWRGIADLGWLGAAVPEEYGGIGLGHEGLCVLAEEIGRAIAPVPFCSSVYLATEALVLFGTEEQKQARLPALCAGERIGTFALAEGAGNPSPNGVKARVSNGRLSGCKWPVLDGAVADFAVVVAQDGDAGPALFCVELTGAGVTRTSLRTVDPSREQSRIDFDDAPAERIGAGAFAWSDVERLIDRAAVLIAFEQVGGATQCLEMATAYAKERTAFGRPIGSFQAIKHKLADVYIATELARSNAYYGAWALSTDAAELPVAAAAARVAGSDAYHLASKENIQTHGGMGFTWQLDCHLYYRRSKMLSLTLGSQPYWRERLVSGFEARVEAQDKAAA